MERICTAVFILTAMLYRVELSTIAYQRPAYSANSFGTLHPGEEVDLQVRTEGGWLGFDPGTAQAGNTGSFRYRWIPPDSSIEATDTLAIVWGPEPGITYAMTAVETEVFEEPDTTTATVVAIPANSAAAVTDSLDGWLQVDLSGSPCQDEVYGWIRLEGVSLNRQ